MSDPERTPKPEAPRHKTPAAETARQEGAQGRTGKGAGDTVSDGEIDASDPAMAAETATVADQVHANA